jgi:hypothetical protein
MTRTCIVLAAAIAAVLATTTTSRGQTATVFTYGVLLTDGHNVAFRANAVGFPNNTAAFDAAIRSLVRASKLDSDISVAFWPPSICGSANASINGWCSFSPSEIKLAERNPVIFVLPVSVERR